MIYPTSYVLVTDLYSHTTDQTPVVERLPIYSYVGGCINESNTEPGPFTVSNHTLLTPTNQVRMTENKIYNITGVYILHQNHFFPSPIRRNLFFPPILWGPKGFFFTFFLCFPPFSPFFSILPLFSLFFPSFFSFFPLFSLHFFSPNMFFHSFSPPPGGGE